jgi:hypothetical protein
MCGSFIATEGLKRMEKWSNCNVILSQRNPELEARCGAKDLQYKKLVVKTINSTDAYHK